MIDRTWGEEYRTTVVCIDAWDDNIPTGRFYNPYQPEGRSFHGIVQFLQEMELALDDMDFPRSYTVLRNFSVPNSIPADSALSQRQTGNLATFAVRILFRQNVTWQGSISWLESRQEQTFRSALELILLMQNAMNEALAEKN